MDSVFVSLQFADPARHDEYNAGAVRPGDSRYSQGEDPRVLHRVRRHDRAKPGKMVNWTESSSSLSQQALHEVFVFDAVPSGRYRDRMDLLDKTDWVEEMIQSALRYNRDPKYPGVTFHSHMSSYRSVGCSCGTSFFYLSPYGDMMSCDFNHAKFGNVLEEPLWRIWEKLSTLPDFCQANGAGAKSKTPIPESCRSSPPGTSPFQQRTTAYRATILRIIERRSET